MSLTSLEMRILRGDLIKVYKIINNKYKCPIKNVWYTASDIRSSNSIFADDIEFFSPVSPGIKQFTERPKLNKKMVPKMAIVVKR
jgi:hypothetical protein